MRTVLIIGQRRALGQWCRRKVLPRGLVRLDGLLKGAGGDALRRHRLSSRLAVNPGSRTMQTQPDPICLPITASPAWLIDRVELDVDIRGEATLVSATLACRRNPMVAGEHAELDGEQLGDTTIASTGSRSTPPRTGRRRPTSVSPGCRPSAILHTRVRILPDARLPSFGSTAAATATSRSANRRARAHHLVHRPARRDGALHGDGARRQGDFPGTARQRQSGAQR